MTASSRSFSRPAHPLALVFGFAGWSAYVWATRIRNAVGDDKLGRFTRAWTLSLSLAFVAVAVVTAALCWRTARSSGSRLRFDLASRRAVAALLGATVLVWALRVPFIVADHSRDVPFKVVHITLAVISVGLGLAARRSVEATATMAPDRIGLP
jgi:hypothetical protein